MSEHFVVRCDCGAVIMQCRCPDANKVERTIPRGCEACKKLPEPEPVLMADAMLPMADL